MTSRAQIVIINDDPIITTKLRGMAAKIGFDVTTFVDCRAALTHVTDPSPSRIVLLDIYLSNGVAIDARDVAKLRQKSKYLVFVTSAAPAAFDQFRRHYNASTEDFWSVPVKASDWSEFEAKLRKLSAYL